jgi:hypothetical protein
MNNSHLWCRPWNILHATMSYNHCTMYLWTTPLHLWSQSIWSFTAFFLYLCGTLQEKYSLPAHTCFTGHFFCNVKFSHIQMAPRPQHNIEYHSEWRIKSLR